MSRGRKKTATTKDRCCAPQKRPRQHKTMSLGPKRLRQRLTNVSRPQKKTRRQRIDVACPKKGPRQHKTMSHGPKGRTDETPTSRGLKKKGHDDEAGTPRLRKGPRQRFAGDESPTRAASKPCCNKPKSYFKYFSEIVIRFIMQSGKKTAFPGSTKLLN